MYKYELNLFENGMKKVQLVKTLSEMDMIFHTGRSSREAFLELINRWNRQGMIGFENHGKTYVHVALSQ